MKINSFISLFFGFFETQMCLYRKQGGIYKTQQLI